MKRPHWLLHVLYYVFSLLIYIGAFWGIVALFKLSGESDNLGAVIVVTYGILFLVLPLLAIVLIRFSMLRWYVDPFAAAIFPFFLYGLMLTDKIQELGALTAAVASVNVTLCRDGGEGWLWMMAMFLFGLAVSFSFARPRGESISYKLLAKLRHRN